MICGSIGTAKPQQPSQATSGTAPKPQPRPQPVNSGGLLVNDLQSAQVNGKDTH